MIIIAVYVIHSNLISRRTRVRITSLLTASTFVWCLVNSTQMASTAETVEKRIQIGACSVTYLSCDLPQDFSVVAYYDDYGQSGAYWDSVVSITTNEGELTDEFQMNRINRVYSVYSKKLSELALPDVFVVDYDNDFVAAFRIDSRGNSICLFNIRIGTPRCYGILDYDNDRDLEFVFQSEDIDYWKSNVRGSPMVKCSCTSEANQLYVAVEIDMESIKPISIFTLNQLE